MISNDKYCEYNTVNSESAVLIVFDSISHIISHKDNETCWVHFHNGKCIHITDSYNNVSQDLRDYLNNV